MVLFKLRPCRPEDEQATVDVRVSTSHPSLSLSALGSSKDAVLEIRIHIRCVSSKQPSRSITISTSGTIFDNAKPEEGHMDNLALDRIGALACNKTQDGSQKVILLGYFKVHRARQDGDDAPDLRERPDWGFVTVPAQDSGEEAVVTHTLTSERLFAYSEKMTRDDLVVGDEYNIALRQDYVGTTWWCWGGLEDELKEKKLCALSRGTSLIWSRDPPAEEEAENEGWVLGEDSTQLKFVVGEGGESCSLEVAA